MQIRVDYEQLLQESIYLKQRGQQYNEVIQRIYARMYEMQSIWQGADNRAFLQKLEQFKPQLQSMHDLIASYATYISRSAICYQTLIEDRIQKAKQLV